MLSDVLDPAVYKCSMTVRATRDVNCVLHRIVKHSCSSLSSDRQGDVNGGLSIKPSYGGALFLVQTSSVDEDMKACVRRGERERGHPQPAGFNSKLKRYRGLFSPSIYKCKLVTV